MLFKQFGGVDADPDLPGHHRRRRDRRDRRPAGPSFGGINLEDISAPRCFEIEDRLKERLDIPVFHDDQHGTAVVALAALENALRLTGRDDGRPRVVISGAGAAGVAVARILLDAGLHGPRGPRPQGRAALRARRPHAGQAGARRDTADHSGRTGGARRRARRRRRLHRRLRRHRARGGRRHDGAGRDHLRAGQPEPRGAPRRRAPARPGRRDRPLRLPQPDQQRARLPRHLPRRLRRARDRDHRGHEARRRRRARRRWSATTCART